MAVIEIKLKVKRTSNMTRVFGRVHTMSALIVTGNGRGLAGYAVGKAAIHRTNNAIVNAMKMASRKLFFVELLEGRTIYQDFYAECRNTRIFAQRRSAGFGLICHPRLMKICEVIWLLMMWTHLLPFVSLIFFSHCFCRLSFLLMVLAHRLITASFYIFWITFRWFCILFFISSFSLSIKARNVVRILQIRWVILMKIHIPVGICLIIEGRIIKRLFPSFCKVYYRFNSFHFIGLLNILKERKVILNYGIFFSYIAFNRLFCVLYRLYMVAIFTKSVAYMKGVLFETS